MTIEQLAMVTRLNKEFIVALEEGRRDKLPGQVYLKPFTKTCAEALDLDLKTLYRAIDGETPEKGGNNVGKKDNGKKPRRFDYKLLFVILAAVIIIAAIYITIDMRDNSPVKTGVENIVPAHAKTEKRTVKWSRPWHRPFPYTTGKLKQNLVLMVTDSVNVSVVSAGDTLFHGILSNGDRRVFSSQDPFVIDLSRNDCVTGYLNGRKDNTIGTGKNKLVGYNVGEASGG